MNYCQMNDKTPLCVCGEGFSFWESLWRWPRQSTHFLSRKKTGGPKRKGEAATACGVLRSAEQRGFASLPPTPSGLFVPCRNACTPTAPPRQPPLRVRKLFDDRLHRPEAVAGSGCIENIGGGKRRRYQSNGIFFSLAPSRFFSLKEKKWVGPAREGASPVANATKEKSRPVGRL